MNLHESNDREVIFMKIEKINDNQIRCTLSKEDLADRNIKLSELAYGTGKTRELFQDMMQQANDDFGFEVNDIPLMVEAIPVSPETIVLVITNKTEFIYNTSAVCIHVFNHFLPGFCSADSIDCDLYIFLKCFQ